MICHKHFLINHFLSDKTLYIKDHILNLLNVTVNRIIDRNGDGEESFKKILLNIYPQNMKTSKL